MKEYRHPPAAGARLVKGFELLRKQLHLPQYAACLDQPVAHWASANDRWLPWALLSRSVREVLLTPLNELLATPSVGPRKLALLLELLGRAADDPEATGHSEADDPLPRREP